MFGTFLFPLVFSGFLGTPADMGAWGPRENRKTERDRDVPHTDLLGLSARKRYVNVRHPTPENDVTRGKRETARRFFQPGPREPHKNHT